MAADSDAHSWDSVAERFRNGQSMDPLLAEDYRRAHLELCRRWAPAPDIDTRVLKTDVFAEAVCPQRAFSWDVVGEGQLVSFDISHSLTQKARSQASARGHTDGSYIVADTRALPFASDAFDLILSDSTLDHFRQHADIHLSLGELVRVLRPGGRLIITLDNPRNITQPLLRLWLRLGWAPFFVGETLSRAALVAALESARMDVIDSGVLVHHLRFFTKVGLRVMRRAMPGRAERMGRGSLALTEKLGAWTCPERTALFVAACAVKPIS